MTSILEALPGIGPGKRRALLRALGSLAGVRRASPAELAAVPGISARDAATLHRFFAASPGPDPGAQGEGPGPAGEAPAGDGQSGGSLPG
jgi:excinuclease ABC subunit C